MRRLLVLAALGATAVVLTVGPSDGRGQRPDVVVDAIFDNAGFLVAGQDVRAAGVRAGEVEAVSLTPGRQARVRMRIDRRFAPLRDDADCTVQSQSLIGERYVQCTPGTPRGRPLRRNGDGVPELPVDATHSPIDLDVVLSTFGASDRVRLQLLLGELGASFAGRGTDLNAALRRANPALQATRDVLDTVGRQRRALTATIADAQRITRELTREPERVARFLRSTSRGTAATARRTREIQAALPEVAELERRAIPLLTEISALSREAGQPLRDLTAAGPPTARLLGRVPEVADTAGPALRALGDAATRLRRPMRDVRPTARRLSTFAASALPVSETLASLLIDARGAGVIEGLLTFVRNAALATARFDATSHVFPSHLIVNECSGYAERESERCSARYAAAPSAQRGRGQGRRGRSPARTSRPATSAPTAAPDASPAPSPPRDQGPVPTPVQQGLDAIGKLLRPADAPSPRPGLLRRPFDRERREDGR